MDVASPEERPVLAFVAQFPAPDLVGQQRPPHVGKELVRMRAGLEQARVAPHRLGGRVACLHLKPRVDIFDGPRLVSDDDHRGALLHRAPELAQLHLGVLALADVQHGGPGVKKSALGIPDGRGGHRDSDGRSVLAAQVPLPLPRGSSPDKRRVKLAEPFGGLGCPQLGQAQTALCFRLRVAQPGQLGGVQLQHQPVRPQRVTTARGVLVEIQRLGGAVAHARFQLDVQLGQRQPRRFHFRPQAAARWLLALELLFGTSPQLHRNSHWVGPRRPVEFVLHGVVAFVWAATPGPPGAAAVWPRWISACNASPDCSSLTSCSAMCRSMPD